MVNVVVVDLSVSFKQDWFVSITGVGLQKIPIHNISSYDTE